MYRDITNIAIADCITIVDSNTLFTYSSSYNETYTLIGNKYYVTNSVTGTQTPSNVICYTQEQISKLPSDYDFITPIYYGLGALSSLLLIYTAYRLILYPFFRKY